jgi:hypothetical protein
MVDRKVLLGCQAKISLLLEIFSKADVADVQEFVTTIQMITVVINKLLQHTGRAKKPIHIDAALIENIYVLLEEYVVRMEEMTEAGGISKLLQQNRRRQARRRGQRPPLRGGHESRRCAQVGRQRAPVRVGRQWEFGRVGRNLYAPRQRGANCGADRDHACRPAGYRCDGAFVDRYPRSPAFPAHQRIDGDLLDSDSACSLVVPAMDAGPDLSSTSPSPHPSWPASAFPSTLQACLRSPISTRPPRISPLSPRTPSRRPTAFAFWSESFGPMNFQVSYAQFIQSYSKYQPGISSSDAEALRSFLGAFYFIVVLYIIILHVFFFFCTIFFFFFFFFFSGEHFSHFFLPCFSPLCSKKKKKKKSSTINFHFSVVLLDNRIRRQGEHGQVW